MEGYYEFRVEIATDTNNEAFDGDNCGPQMACILRAVADKVEDVSGNDLPAWGGRFPLYDVVGNKVGAATWVHIDYASRVMK